MEPRSILVAGATGLVGAEVLAGALADRSVAHVHALVRRMPTMRHEKLTTHVVEFAALPTLPRVDEAYLALGTTIKAAGSQAAFRAIDFDANLAVAKAAIAAGARRAGLVSAMGADPRSAVFYSRVKGDLEDALAGLGFEGLVIVRPSFLVGNREALGQPARPLEHVALGVSRVLGPLIPANYAPVEAARVARTLLTSVPTAKGKVVILSGAIR